MTPLLSVAIPTHNRARYALHAIRSLLTIQDARLEVIVSDTSTDGELNQLIGAPGLGLRSDPRLKYVRPEVRLDMTGNHNAALALATGEYICLIGDDDTISSQALEAADWAVKHGVEAIAPNVVANYVWPDFRSRYFGKGHASRIYFNRSMGSAKFQQSEDALAGALLNAAQGTDGLPKIYHGIVKRSLMEQIRKASGAYFHGSSPDVSGAIGLALFCKRFLIVDYPLTIPGASGGSNTGRSAMNQHKGKLNSEEQTRGFENKGWSRGVPRFFSVETVWAHAGIETLALIDPSLISGFNFARLIAASRIRHGEFRPEIDRAASEATEIQGASKASFEGRVAGEIRQLKRDRLTYLLKRLTKPSAAGGRNYVAGLPDIAAAPAELASYMARRGPTWSQVVAGIS